MNYLAHAYLSFNQPEILVGNMISDFVKGKKKYSYSAGIQKGIALHRAIDTFTDSHASTKAAKQYLKPAVAAYSGAFIDVVYDHFLANDQQEFSDGSLRSFAADAYKTLHQFQSVLPVSFSLMLPYMIKQNWLYNYKSKWGIEHSFGGIVRRAKYLDSSDDAFTLFEMNYSTLQKCYKDFFPALKQYAAQYMQQP